MKTTPHINQEKGANLVPGTVKPLHQRGKKSLGIRGVAGLTLNRLLMRVDNSAGKGTSGMNKFGSVIDRMSMKLGSNFPNSLRIKTQILKRLQCVIVVNSATRSQKNGVKGMEAP